MTEMEIRPRRKTSRLKGYNYRTKGAYLATICTQNRECRFGRIENGVMQLNGLGRIVEECIQGIPQHFPMVDVMAHVVMPNHVHLLLGLGLHDEDVGCPVIKYSLGEIINVFKGSVRRIYGSPVWQTRFYDHVIRGASDLLDTKERIKNNPAKWEEDKFFVGDELRGKDAEPL